MPANMPPPSSSANTSAPGPVAADRPRTRENCAEDYQNRRILVVSGHSSIPVGEPVACDQVTVLSYTQPGTSIWSNESKELLDALDNQGILIPTVHTRGHTSDGTTYPPNDVSLKVNTDCSPNYRFHFDDHNGYEAQCGYLLGYYFYSPSAPPGQKLEYWSESRNEPIVYPGTAYTDLCIAKAVASKHNIDTILTFGCKNGNLAEVPRSRGRLVRIPTFTQAVTN